MKFRPSLLAFAAVGVAGLVSVSAPVSVKAQVPAAGAQPAPVLRVNVEATVDDEAISTYDVRQRMIFLLVSTGTQATAEIMPQIQREALRSLIEEKLKSQELRRQEDLRKLKRGTLFVPETEVESYFDRLAAQNNVPKAQFLAQLESAGVSLKDFREQIRIARSWDRWMVNFYGSRVRISDEQINTMIREIEAASSKPSYLVSEIFIDASRTGSVENAVNVARQLLGLLQQNARFEALAQQYSALPTAANGGDAGWLSVAELEPAVAAAVESLRPGQVTPPVATRDGAYIVLVRDRRAPGGASRVSLRQAAVMLPQDATPQAIQAAQAQLMSVKSRVQGGCQGLEAAAQSVRGVEVTDLGEAETTDLAPAFRQAVETLQPNQISDPVRTPVGLHLIAVCNRSAAGVDVPTREDIENDLFARQISMIQRRELRNLWNAATINQRQ